MDHRLTRFHVSGFRRLYNLDLEMRPLMVMIGANGVGKTSLLDAFSLLAASAEGGLQSKLSEHGGLQAVLPRENQALSIGIDLTINGGRRCYQYSLENQGVSYLISKERITQDEKDVLTLAELLSEEMKSKPFDPNPNRLETSLSQLSDNSRELIEIRHSLASRLHYHSLDVGPRAPVKQQQTIQPAATPGINGEQLIPFLFSLRESYTYRYEAIEDSLKAAFPGFQKLVFLPIAAGMIALTWKDKDFTNPLFMHQLSEGIIRFLWLASLLQSPELPTVTMIDEPEVSLHPELLALLADLLREASRRTHLVVATHSERLIRFLKPEEVVTMDINEDGGASAVWADTFDLEEWLKEYSLDEVWRMGRMGGRS